MIFKNLKRKFLKYILKKFYNSEINTQCIFYRNINLNYNIKQQKNVLISYITSGIEQDNTFEIYHTNTFESIQIIQTFIKMGYCIDLINCYDVEHIPQLEYRKYDVIFGFGEPFYEACLLNPNSLKISYLTESEPNFSMSQEKERIQYFFERHKIKAPIRRSGVYLKPKYIQISDCGILLGNEKTRNTFNGMLKKIFLLTPTGLFNEKYLFFDREIKDTRRTFIWFGAYGAIHKGLDILIDVFKIMSDYTLYICGLNAEEKLIFENLDQYKNIIDVGFINVKSDRFLRLVHQASFVILPSCSEGMATSVLTCMNHSLIPIVTKETGVDVFDFGIYIENYHVDNLMQTIKSLEQLNEFDIQCMHKKVYEYAAANFNLKRFSSDFENIIKNIIENRY